MKENELKITIHDPNEPRDLAYKIAEILVDVMLDEENEPWKEEK